MKIISFDTDNTSYQMGITDDGFLLHLYYGPKTGCDMDYSLTMYDRGFSGNPYDVGNDRTFSLDVLPMEYPGYGNGDYRSPAFSMRDSSGVQGADLRYRSHRFLPGKYGIDGMPAVYAAEDEARTLEIVLADETAGVQVTLKYGIIPSRDAVTRAAVIENISDSTITVDKALSASLDSLSGNWDIIHFDGRHGMERLPQRDAVRRGKISIGSRRGTSSHQHNPFIVLASEETGEDYGSCTGLMLAYSGNFKAEAERDQYGLTRTGIGFQDEMFDYPLAPGEKLETPEAIMIHSDEGLSDLSQKYHALISEHIVRGPWQHKRRPVLINNWEATYFDFTGDKIVSIAEQAAQLGVEMIVLDDGWFGARNTENAGLGDWTVNEEKLGGPLSSVVNRIKDLGMQFGLWIEPEMVNEDSDLYREHPDWAYTVPGKKPVRGRNQLVLDFSRDEVVDAIFEQISAVIASADISYIKMDMNRSIMDVFSRTDKVQHYGKTMHAYVKGVYRFIEMLRQRFPELLIEGCSGGGGRFDAGMLYYTPQIWCSDNTDAIDRIQIQRGTSFGYPIQTIGSHVSQVPNEQTGRIVDFATRGIVAQAGTFGYELDLNLISDEEKEEVKKQIADYKKYWPLIANGSYYRLHSPEKDTETASWCFAAEDKSEALMSAVTLDNHCNNPVSYVRCRGLDPAKMYHVEPVLGADTQPLELSGQALMTVGLPVPIIPGEYKAWQWHVTSKDTDNLNNKEN